MAKPNINTDWNTSSNTNRVEPSPGAKSTGIQQGGTWARQWLNWMFYGINQWINWVRDDAMDRTENLNDLSSKPTARTNLDVYSKSESDGRYLNESNNLSDLDDTPTARDNLDVYSKTQVDNSFLSVSSNLSEVSDNVQAVGNLGFEYGSVLLSPNSSTTVPLSGAIQIAMTSTKFSGGDQADSSSVSWSGSTLTVRNSSGGARTVYYIAIVST